MQINPEKLNLCEFFSYIDLQFVQRHFRLKAQISMLVSSVMFLYLQ